SPNYQTLHPFPTRRSSDLNRCNNAKRNSLSGKLTTLPVTEVIPLINRLKSVKPYRRACRRVAGNTEGKIRGNTIPRNDSRVETRSEEHTSELQSQSNLVCR